MEQFKKLNNQKKIQNSQTKSKRTVGSRSDLYSF